MKREVNLKCIVDGCNRSSAKRHAVCEYHLFFEITALVVIVVLVLGAFGTVVLGILK